MFSAPSIHMPSALSSTIVQHHYYYLLQKRSMRIILGAPQWTRLRLEFNNLQLAALLRHSPPMICLPSSQPFDTTFIHRLQPIPDIGGTVRFTILWRHSICLHYILQCRCLQPIQPSDLPNQHGIDLSSLASIAAKCIPLFLENEETFKFVSYSPPPR